VDRFGVVLRPLWWDSVIKKQMVDDAFEDFSSLFISRQNKIKLQKIAITSRLPNDITKVKQYRNVLNSLIRVSKNLYFEQNLFNSKKNPRITWELLKEATNLVKFNSKIEKIKINNVSWMIPPKWLTPLINSFPVLVPILQIPSHQLKSIP
jgi:hypothetical protein